MKLYSKIVTGKERFIFEQSYHEFQRNPIAKNNGFRYNFQALAKEERYWYTEDMGIAARLLNFADGELRSRLEKSSITPKLKPTLRYDPDESMYVFRSEKAYGMLAKEAGLFWNSEDLFWWTPDPDHAHKLAEFADDRCRVKLQEEVEELEAARQMSRATDSDIEIPIPDGLEMRGYQKAGVAAMVNQFSKVRKNGNPPGVLLADVPGLGKLQPVDSKVLTPSGWQEIGSLRPGDLVIGSNGKSNRITAVYPQGKKEIYRLYFSDGSSVEAGDEHLWTFLMNQGGKSWQEITLTTEQIRKGMTISRSWKDRKSTSLNLSKANFYLPLLSAPAEFENQELPITPYLLGALIANGYLGKGTPVLTSNILDAEEIAARLTADQVSFSFRVSGNVGRFTIRGLVEKIHDLGLTCNSRGKFIPRSYLCASPADRIALFHGLMDGDGSISKERNKLTYHSINHQLCKDVQELVECLGGIASIREYDRSKENKPCEYQVRIRLPLSIKPFMVSRKLSRFNPGKNALPCRRFLKAEYSRIAESVCIAVEAEDHLYVTEQAILTHNTIQAIGLLNYYLQHGGYGKTLIVLPASLKINWFRELSKWSLDFSERKICFATASSPLWKFQMADIVILNYEVLAKLLEWSKEPRKGLSKSRQHVTIQSLGKLNYEWDFLIADEAHLIKNRSSLRSRMTLELTKKAKRVVYMTGTPIVNYPEELFTLIHALDPETWPSFHKYVRSYCGSFYDESSKSQKSKLAYLQDKLRGSGLMIRRLKEQVLKDLPPKIHQIIEIPVEDAAAAAAITKEMEAFEKHQALLDQLRLNVELAKASDDPRDYENAVKALSNSVRVAFTEIARLRHETARRKVPYVIAHLKAIWEEEPGRKIVVMAWHQDVIDQIVEAFEGEAVMVTGQVDSTVRINRAGIETSARMEAVDRFTNEEKIKLFVGNIKAAGVGLNLQVSSFLIFAEQDYVPGNMEQGADRVHRIGQNDSVLIQYLVLENSLDVNIVTTFVAKQQQIDKALDKDTGVKSAISLAIQESLDKPPAEIPDEELIVPVPKDEEAATQDLKRAALDKLAAMITPEQILAIHQGLQLLSAICDGAAALDNHGFNRLDTGLGKSLARCQKLTPRQAVLGKKIVIKYKRQLPAALLETIQGSQAEVV